MVSTKLLQFYNLFCPDDSIIFHIFTGWGVNHKQGRCKKTNPDFLCTAGTLITIYHYLRRSILFTATRNSYRFYIPWHVKPPKAESWLTLCHTVLPFSVSTHHDLDNFLNEKSRAPHVSSSNLACLTAYYQLQPTHRQLFIQIVACAK